MPKTKPHLPSSDLFAEFEFLRHSNNIEDVWDDLSLQQAFFAWEYLKTQKKIDIPVVLKVHKILMLHQPLQPDQKGYLRKVPVWIGGEEAPHYSQIRAALESWCLDVAASVLDPGIEGEHIRLDHLEYERIHPFVDGNGRTGRLFMNWQRLKAGLPLLIIREPEKYAYYTWFR